MILKTYQWFYQIGNSYRKLADITGQRSENTQNGENAFLIHLDDAPHSARTVEPFLGICRILTTWTMAN